MIYTVDEVSDLLGIPRPTLYRYLREYSIPHVRRSGKISIPEEAFDRIREARELHKEGLGTESVRQRLREGSDFDAGELTERLDQLSEGLESLQDLKIVDGVSSSQETLQTILERQDSLLCAVSDLTGMVESLLETNGRHRKVALSRVERGIRTEKTFLDQLERFPEVTDAAKRERATYRYAMAESIATDRAISNDSKSVVAVGNAATMVVDDDPPTRISSRPTESLTATSRSEKFGALARRRRRGVLGLLLALLAGAVLVWVLLASTGDEVEEELGSGERGTEENSQSVPTTTEATRMVTAPYLVRASLTQAEERLAEAGLKLGSVSEIPSYEAPAGEVVEQGPQVGTGVEPGTAVNVVVSGGPPTNQPGVQADGTAVVGGVEQYPGGGAQNLNGGSQPQPFTAVPVGAAQAW